MPKFFFQGSYTVEGAKGLLEGGGSRREAAVKEMVEGLGGKLESFYFAFGDKDVLGVMELPDNVSTAAISIAVAAAGGANVKFTVLLTPEEIDRAVKKTVGYRAPGK